MRSRKIYIPCLRWKQGEYQAVLNMSPETKDSILPIIDVAEFFISEPEISFDFEDSKPAKTIDEHLSKFAKRVKAKWGTNECFVDLRLIEAPCRLDDGQHPISYIFNALRSEGIEAIPVVGLERDSQYRASVRKTITVDNRGVCLRCSLQKASGSGFVEIIDALLGDLHVGPEQCDFIFDLDAPNNYEPLDVFAGLLEPIVKNIPHLNAWRSFGLIGTSIPASVSKLPDGITTLQRSEWQLYKRLASSLKASGVRVPTFGDYVINHPAALNLDMRFIYPKAAVKYTINDGWLISRGSTIRGRKGVGLGQFRDLCKLIVESRYYSGPSFSFGDDYIFKCANEEVRPGSLSRFLEVGTSHHLEMVVRDLARLGVS
jgi:hypothetical protein